MAIREILQFPDARLEIVSDPVNESYDQLESLVADMIDTMFAANGIGLAAIQMGESRRVFIIDAVVAGGEAKDLPLVFVNPEIVELSDEKETAEEGCLSFPGIYITVERPIRCRTRAQGLDGSSFEVEGEGLFARAMQHENDHLNGRLISDHVGKLKRKMIVRRLKRATKSSSNES